MKVGKIYIDSVKYIIRAHIIVEGNVEKPDVIGALFGQTEGLLGGELEMRELQKTGRIGRIDAELSYKNGKTTGKIIIPSGLGLVETAIIAAAIETVDRVGPCEAKVVVEKIEDTRGFKRKYLIERAKELLKKAMYEEIPDSKEIVDAVKSELRMHEIVKYGKENLPAGPKIDESDEIIIVEGRADVLNLLKHGIKNVIAINGAKIPKTIIDLTRKKISTLFVDGDRGGEMIVREMLEKADVDFIAKAPDGKEVEELTQKEILKALRKKVPAEMYMQKENTIPEDLKKYVQELEDLKGSLSARLLDEEGAILAEVPVRDIWNALKGVERVHAVVMDGIITQRLVDTATSKGAKYVVGVKKTKLERVPEHVVIFGD